MRRLISVQRFPIENKVIDGIHLSVHADPKKLASETSQSQFTGCNLTNAQMYYSKYGRDISPDAVLFKRKALEVLSTAINALDRLGVRFWLSSGTCLGKKNQEININFDVFNCQVIVLFRTI